MALLLIVSCDGRDNGSEPHKENAAVLEETPDQRDTSDLSPPEEPLEPADTEDEPQSGILYLSVRTTPLEPENEVYLGDWRIRLFGIDDEARRNTSVEWGMTGWDGNAIIEISHEWFDQPILVTAYNDVMPFNGCGDGECTDPDDATGLLVCRQLQILIPPNCFDKTVWFVGPLEDAVWQYYQNAAARHGQGWTPNQVDCVTWIDGLQNLLLTDDIQEELHNLDKNQFGVFQLQVLSETLQEHQQLLLPTRPPICMAEYRHDGGGMNSGAKVELPIVLDDSVEPFIVGNSFVDPDPIEIGKNGVVSNICGVPLTGSLKVNHEDFFPEQSNVLEDRDFIGIVSHQANTAPNIDVSLFNTKLGNGRPLDSPIYDDACALTNVVQFTNTATDEQPLVANSTGTTFANLFGDGQNTVVYLTSDGDAVVDDEDTWVIFYQTPSVSCEEVVFAVELLGFRRGDFRDVLSMVYDVDTEDLFLGLIGDYELNEEELDGERAFLSYTMHVWDGSTVASTQILRSQFGACYLAADDWALQFFELQDVELTADTFGEACGPPCPLDLAEFAVRSQCFSNSISNQRWQTDDAGYWSINSNHGVAGNVVINPGWLGPDLNFDIYIERFDETVFKGPRGVGTTDEAGQMMLALPTLVEGDRVLLKAQDSCCDDYDLILPCVPAFTGFVNMPGIPYVPQKYNPAPPLP